MEVQTIIMPAEEAKQKYDEYLDSLRGREPSEEDRGIVLGYRALAKGRAVIDLYDVFRRCPADEQGRPKLAVARAHWRWLHLHRRGDGEVRFSRGVRRLYGSRVAWHSRFDLPAGTLAEPCRNERDYRGEIALVPLVPPNLRPARGLNRYCILFEAEWKPVPPTDPMLLRQLHGALYAVFAAWELTSLERAVLAGRLTESR